MSEGHEADRLSQAGSSLRTCPLRRRDPEKIDEEQGMKRVGNAASSVYGDREVDASRRQKSQKSRVEGPT